MVHLFGSGRYALGQQLGKGGMGTVYEAEDLARGERVAVKILHAEHAPDGVVAEHMARELRIGRAIRHRNVVAVLDGGRDDDRPYVAMELVVGRVLGIAAAEDRPSVGHVVAIVDQILTGLAAIHRAGFVHGDVKCDNVLVARADDGSDCVKIIDLGLARELDVRGEAEGHERVISGTPDYVAPEIVVGAPKTVASEVYAVGVILYELLTGTTPFGGVPMFEILRRQVEEEVVPPSLRAPELRLSLALERVILRALEKRPEARYADAGEFRAALRAAMRWSISDAPAIVRGFSTSSATNHWTRPELPPRLAVGTPYRAGDGTIAIVAAALEAARVHVAAHRLASARSELEAALALIDGETAAEAQAWRIWLALAAVCDGLGDAREARRIARAALDSAVRARSELGRRRARALIERFGGRLVA